MAGNVWSRHAYSQGKFMVVGCAFGNVIFSTSINIKIPKLAVFVAMSGICFL